MFLAIDAKGGEGALECLDQGGAHGLLMEIIRFRLPLATHAYLYCFTYLCLIGLRLVFGFEHLVCNV